MEWLVPILAFVAATALGGAALGVTAIRRRVIQARLGRPAVVVSAAARPPLATALLTRIGRILSLGRTSPRLQEELTKAGYHGASPAMMYLGSKALLLAAGLPALLAVSASMHVPAPTRVAAVACGAGGLFFLPNMLLKARCRKRSQEVRHHLPDAIDLLEVCVSSGIGLDMAWNLVSDEIRRVSPVLADEMALTNLEIHLGAPRVAAMRHMSIRTGAEELGSLVAVLVQSERFGTSISDALRAFAGSMRENRSLRAEESAEKMAIKLLFPMILFIFPVVLIVIAGPAGITLARVMGGK